MAFLDQAQEALNGIIGNDVITQLQNEINEPLAAFTTGAHPQQAGFQITDPSLASIARTLQMMLGDAPGIPGTLASSGLGLRECAVYRHGPGRVARVEEHRPDGAAGRRTRGPPAPPVADSPTTESAAASA